LLSDAGRILARNNEDSRASLFSDVGRIGESVGFYSNPVEASSTTDRKPSGRHPKRNPRQEADPTYESHLSFGIGVSWSDLCASVEAVNKHASLYAKRCRMVRVGKIVRVFAVFVIRRAGKV